MTKVEQLLTSIEKRFKDTVECKLANGQLTLELEPSNLLLCAKILRDEAAFKFNQLIDICGVDYLEYGIGEWATDSATSEGFSRGVVAINATPAPHEENRFAVVYHLLSTTLNQRIRLRVFLRGEPPKVPSVIDIWRSADWYEREAFDLYGIIFDGHTDLRRILTDYGFIGHPFRKDFPLIGQVEMRYDATESRVVYEPVSIEPRTLVPKIIRRTGQTENG